jgi:hypothetical protein
MTIEPGGQRVHACNRNRSLGALLVLDAVTVAFGTSVGLPLCLGCKPTVGDSFCSI